MMLRRAILPVLLVSMAQFAQSQDLNLGAKFGVGFSRTEFNTQEFNFSTTDNEIAYLVGIEKEKLFQGPVLQLEYKSKNRFAFIFNLNFFSLNYEYLIETSNLVQYKPALSTDYVHTSVAVSIDLIQTKLVKPYLRLGAGLNGLLAVEEQENDGVIFTEIYNRELRNSIIFDYLNQQNSVYYSANIGLGFKVYNFFIEGLVSQNLTAIDSNNAYGQQTKLFVNFGVNLLRFDLVKKQKL